MERLFAVVEHRRETRPPASYTVELFEAGHPAIASKIIEEAYELIATGEAEDFPSRGEIIHEAADLVYHLLVFLAHNQVAWRDVERELEDRFGVSGLVEKAQRSRTTPDERP